MMKRILILTLCLMLLIPCPVLAINEPYALLQSALYRIVLRTEAGDTTIGSGVLFMQNNVLLTAQGCCVEGELFAIGEDGEHAVKLAWPEGSTGVALMELATPSSAAPLTLSDYDQQSLPYVFGTDAEGNMGAAPLYQMLYARYRDQNALTLSCEEGILPGAFISDDKGNILGLVVSQQMEGYGMYTALGPDALYQAITGGEETSSFLPLEVSWDSGLLNVSWTDDPRTDGVYLLTISAEENLYYTSYEVPADEQLIHIAVPPGYTYYMQVQWVENGSMEQELLWSAMTSYTVPKLGFTQYGFRQNCYLAAAPAGQEVSDALEELSPVTPAILADEAHDLYLQVFNTYDVSEEITVPMTVSLTAPDGQVYFEELSYLFAPEYEQNDSFAVPVDELFASCMSFSGTGGLPEGSYVLSYSIAGRTAGEYAFTLESEK